ncbi:ABC transporter ATP-binding protein [Donghicola sp. C2-DW-16]|uniref:ABC transporter ATP-binding protein n=1 Tax=Donghicola mangrovi TaxID=2729614 RepID=A0ABX2PCR1_9RHOB|nr:ABC transporter ATP-binding protein [Donghicola mangrovi]NVO27267.1 ABC transporter ATP-binding protein [Donghicola mangrovi]
MPKITLSHLTKRYSPKAAAAVDNITFTVEDGSFTCILGPSGCGKSTILRMIAGLETLSEGEIDVDGRVLDSVTKGIFVPPEKRGIGLVFQSYALWPHMTVAQNIEFGLKIQKMPAAQRKARVAQMVATLRIEGLEDRYPAQLSGGQQQRVALARTLAVTPGILLLDEPLSNLDAALRLTMRAELSRLHREFGTTIVFVTHDQWEAMTLATHIAVMSKGALQQYAPASQIYEAPANRFVADFIGNPPINMLPAASHVARSFARAAGLDAPAHELGLRPEGITLGLSESAGAVTAIIESILPTGGSWLVELTCADDAGPIRLVQSTQTPPRWRVGQAVYVSALAEAMHLFSDTGARIASGVSRSPDHSRSSAGVI